MPTYLSPGVYVEEIASGSAPITGVGTSIAAFIGTITTTSAVTNQINPSESSRVETVSVNQSNQTGEGKKKFELPKPTNLQDGEKLEYIENSAEFSVDGNKRTSFEVTVEDNTPFVSFTTEVPNSNPITGSFQITITSTISNSPTTAPELSTYNFKEVAGEKNGIGKSVSEGEIKLITNFSEFKKFFGDFLDVQENQGQNTLAHAVYGFFRNGGTRCYVTWITEESKVAGVLDAFEAIDEITIVAAPGNLDVRDDIKDHCEKMGDRIAILDSVDSIDLSSTGAVDTLKPFNSAYAALYFPWIQVFDPASNSNIYIPPSGHIAGIYARVDGQRGVHKAPANETILGALDLKYNLSKSKQDGLNPDGINVIRKLNGNIRVWGARTLGGDANGEFKYINIRRHFSYLRDSIDKGTQWTVFEPNTPELWAKIRRNVNAFLVTEWRKGALFGTTPEEAFYVKCDAENNPPEVRDLGQVVTEIGLAVVKPAEFVIFRLSQWSSGS
ncbi:phage tail sheath family protein [Nodularia sp. NIES-3585]|uniref:phage tail sheath family protein n=1 Tax=Nodularia sp. NIES-3585 TaxID=1973477 RepID=UPI000B5C8109|nr:phage tail sheath subtilisin-like domain-containing protein [Nodularia sp. NIES-3585]GAX37264.1 phage tail sheath protein [Nodularia sp. NIES-3585]